MTLEEIRAQYELRMRESDSYGFRWGNLCVNRLGSDAKGYRALEIVTPRGLLEIEVTPSGLIKVNGTVMGGATRA